VFINAVHKQTLDRHLEQLSYPIKSGKAEYLGKYWEDRMSAEGSILQPGEEWNLVIVLTSQASETAVTETAKIIYKGLFGGLDPKYW